MSRPRSTRLAFWLPALASVFFGAICTPRDIAAQTRPTTAEAQALLQARPEVVAQLRERLASSGLSPAQVRQRLRAEGYPESLLDAYLPDVRDEAQPEPSNRVFEAIKALGITDADDVDALQARLTGRRLQLPPPTVNEGDLASSASLSPESAELFGYSLFREQTTRFDPNLDGPVDEGYRIGPGDELVLILTGDVELAYTLEVTRSGFVVIPQVGQVGVANLTLGELEDLLYTRLGRVYSGVRRGADAATRFSINVSRLRSNQIFVTGDVVTPGAFRVSSAGTALSALYAAGGPTAEGSMRAIEVRRGGTTVSTLDVYQYLLRGDATRDVRMQQGDVLFVPPRGPRVRIDGEVARPATYELEQGEQLRDLLSMAGGLRTTATGRRVLVDRILPLSERGTGGADRSSIDVALSDAGSAPAFPLLDGDVVRVPGISNRLRNRIVVNGHVWQPGPQGYTPGLTLEEALQRAGGVQPDAYLGRVLISRLLPDSTRVQLRATLRDSSGATVTPFALQPDDEITTFSRTAFRAERYVAIAGAVRNSGRYPYREGMTLRDLVLQAGGLTGFAELSEAEIARRPDGGDPLVISESLRVPLDSGYLFAEGRTPPPDAQEQPLEPFDNVLIFVDPERRAPVTVSVYGEVQLPGVYTLETRTDRVADLISRAGGLTTQGDAAAAYFSRLNRETEQVSRLVRSAEAAVGDSLQDAAGDTARLDEGGERVRVGVDLVTALRRPDRADNLFLVDGDSLFIPPRQQTVTVRGEVNAPTQVVVNGESISAYVRAAGGATPRGKASRAYVIQPNGKIESSRRFLWIVTREPTPRPGATVVVPVEDEARSGNMLQTLTLITQTLTALATVVVLARR